MNFLMLPKDLLSELAALPWHVQNQCSASQRAAAAAEAAAAAAAAAGPAPAAVAAEAAAAAAAAAAALQLGWLQVSCFTSLAVRSLSEKRHAPARMVVR